MVVASELIDLAENVKGRLKFYTHGSPERRLLQNCHDALSEAATALESPTIVHEIVVLDAEMVRDWLSDQGVNLTVRQRRILGIEPDTRNTRH